MDTLKLMTMKNSQMALFLNKKQPICELFVIFVKRIWFRAGWETLRKAGDLIFLSPDQISLQQGCSSVTGIT